MHLQRQHIHSAHRHSREGGNPGCSINVMHYRQWIPAFAGMTMCRFGREYRNLKIIARLALAVLLTLCLGCGLIADKDRIKIAKVKNRYITRGDLAKVIRDMPDDERPMIKNKGDLLRVLNEYLDQQIKGPLAEELEQQLAAQGGKTLVPRELAMQRYFEDHKDDDYAAMYSVTDPATVGMNQAQLEIMKQQIDLGIDRTLEKLKGDAAVGYRAIEAFKQGTLAVTDAEYEREYNLRKDTLKKFEWVRFMALRFQADAPNSELDAATVRKRVDAGEKFEAVLEEYKAQDPKRAIESEIENNPSLAKFQGFWMNASGCQTGDVIGPVFLPDYQVMTGADAKGRQKVQDMPAAYLVLKVLDHRPETTLTLDEAKASLMPTILLAKAMEQLRKENYVEIFDKKLPDPSMFTDKYGKSFVDGA